MEVSGSSSSTRRNLVAGETLEVVERVARVMAGMVERKRSGEETCEDRGKLFGCRETEVVVVGRDSLSTLHRSFCIVSVRSRQRRRHAVPKVFEEGKKNTRRIEKDTCRLELSSKDRVLALPSFWGRLLLPQREDTKKHLLSKKCEIHRLKSMVFPFAEG